MQASAQPPLGERHSSRPPEDAPAKVSSSLDHAPASAHAPSHSQAPDTAPAKAAAQAPDPSRTRARAPSAAQQAQAPGPGPQSSTATSGPAPSLAPALAPDGLVLVSSSKHGLSTPAIAGVTAGAACLCLGATALAAVAWHARRAAKVVQKAPSSASPVAKSGLVHFAPQRSLESIQVHSPFEEDASRMEPPWQVSQGDCLVLPCYHQQQKWRTTAALNRCIVFISQC